MNEELRRQAERVALDALNHFYGGSIEGAPDAARAVAGAVLNLMDAQPAAVSLPEEAEPRCESCHDAIEQNEACVLDPTGDRWHLCNRFGVDCWEYANTPLTAAPAVSLELPEPQQTFTGMRCPHCTSTDVECFEDTKRHAHRCNTCGALDVFRGGPIAYLPPIEDAGSGGVW